MSTPLTRQDVVSLIQRNDRAVGRALVALYERQTPREQETRTTEVHNKQGFSAFDAELLTGLALHYQARGALTPRQLAAARKRLPKYARQLLEVARARALEAPPAVAPAPAHQMTLPLS